MTTANEVAAIHIEKEAGIRWFQQLSQSAPEGIVIVTDANVAQLPLFQKIVKPNDTILATIVLSAGESTKSWQTIDHILTTLSRVNASRKTALISIGGGVVSDLSGFAAAIYRRGMIYHAMPTTLLAQIDAAIGGKNGINTDTAKNVIGTFYHPKTIVIDPDFLHTLPVREFNAGLAEMIKYGLIADAEFFQWIEENLTSLLAKKTDTLITAISRCCEIKNAIVVQDEKEEKGLRQLLNFGHTLGHALESVTHYKTFLHGEAVAIGMSQAARVSHQKGYITSKDVERIIGLLQRCQLPTSLPPLEKNQLMKSMEQDKKNSRTKSHIVLLSAIGSAALQEQDPIELLN